ncbi:hypothetical protein GPECTOR_967g233 [Gonium pectorale]|uniref:Uncharacterized protein n=1 Tax=Gonium pectorale TaxID=33097 RepID=A0A150FTS5_GONPE|nr:hypothetical protein GPECTOR_967g233 [Gonium pectorale]|eukprot:KXZ41021.1 hypothetical protein GPECTOR_967g233 [Gonium pectorale]
MSALRLLALAALLAVAWGLSETAWLTVEYRRELIAEVGAAAYEHHSIPCDPKVVGSVRACFDQSIPAVGNQDYKWGSKEISFPTDGAPWGVHLTGPYPDGRSYLVTWYTGGPTVGANLSLPDTSKEVATASLTPSKGSARRFNGSVIAYLRAFTIPALAGSQ